MMSGMKRWIFPISILVATCFGVFVLPFFFPLPYLAGISVSNVAGFNNKVAAVVAAVLAAVVFFVSLRWPGIAGCASTVESTGDFRPLSRRFVWITGAICGGVFAFLSFLIYNSHVRYLGDAGYFIEQLGKYTDYGRRLYSQIEFPYGPLTFYAPVAVRAILFPFHPSALAAYFITLLLEYFVGLVLLAYVINHLQMLRRWKMLTFVLCSVATIHLSFGLNYSPFRFIMPAAFLVAGTMRKQSWAAAVWFFAGEIVCLAVSPEMGFAFGTASVAYAVYRTFLGGRAWIVAVTAPFLATVVFLLIAGSGYLLMLKLFAAGIFNFVVEPLPHTISYLFALIWLVPVALAFLFRQRRPEAPMLGALFIFALALLPVALGRADPGHVIFNGLMVYLLSMVAISLVRRSWQNVWAVCLTLVFLFSMYVGAHTYEGEWLVAMPYGLVHHETKHLFSGAAEFVRTRSLVAAKKKLVIVAADHSFNLKALQAITGNAPVALPFDVPPYIEEAMKRTGQYVPLFYAAPVGVYDVTAEDHLIRELNTNSWALVPQDFSLHFSESPKNTRFAMGLQITYPSRHEPYAVGPRLMDNLRTAWQPAGEVGAYELYRRRQP